MNITSNKILFFDLDGTLVDTNLANFLSYKKAILSVTKANYELTYNPDKRFNRSVLQASFPNLTETEFERIIQKKEEFYNEFLHEIKLNTVIVNILMNYSKTNKTFLVTNCRKDRAVTTLRHFGLLDKFSEIFCRELSDNNKRINKFQNAIIKLDVLPSQIVIFEDEDTEIADAIKAGISIINPTYP